MKKLAFFLILYSNFTFTQSAKLDKQEVKVLAQIWGKLGLTEKRRWDFEEDPCSGQGEWQFSVRCDCSFNKNSTCRVTAIYIISENVSTALPVEFSKLLKLEVLDVGQNYLKGTIPSEWATMRLITLTLEDNRLSGPFPTTLTSITSLQYLNIRGNDFSGLIPEHISKLNNLERLFLSSNKFRGLSVAIENLTNLNDLRISDNNFTGKIPSFISRWTQITKLELLGSSFEGPIPSSISLLTQLDNLKISDLKVQRSTFPSVEKMTELRTLILRNCLIHGTIPNYIGNLRHLHVLDISFNNLSGKIPPSFSQLVDADYIFLTENKLTGPMPGWVLSSTKNVDVSYNHFTWDRVSAPKKCEQDPTNVVESYSSITNEQSNIHPCLRKDFPCTKSYEQQICSLYINCGDYDVTVNNTNYEGDTERKGPSSYYNAGNWAFSSTGAFVYDIRYPNTYILSNTSNLNNISTVNTALYTKARTAANSLTYYGLCLMNGHYTVRLHFAEIVFTEYSPRKRVFDVYVQGELKLKDFDIIKEAGGIGRELIKSYTVNVKNNTLKIQLYWAGKGKPNFPLTETNGPIISAISVDAKLRGIDLQTGIFTMRQIKAATKNFDPSNKLGEGGFGSVYKGRLSDGTIIAVKQLSSKSKQGAREFVNEVGLISALRHPNLVRLYGCCVEGNQMILVYEYMENNCLSQALLGTNRVIKAKLTWPMRINVCKGIAQGLVYLHEESNLRIIHRDIKASNVLLDENWNAKISDFGLAKLNDDGNTHISTRIVGTMGYLAPEYAMRGHLTTKADVYSFGILALEIVSGISCNKSFSYETEECLYLFEWVWLLHEKETILELVDPDLGSEYSSEEALTIIQVALLCTKASTFARPTMSQTLSVLEGRTNIQDLEKELRPSTTHLDIRRLRKQLWLDHSETDPTSAEPPTTESFVTDSFITESFIS